LQGRQGDDEISERFRLENGNFTRRCKYAMHEREVRQGRRRRD
jgi:hypothetical protein